MSENEKEQLRWALFHMCLKYLPVRYGWRAAINTLESNRGITPLRRAYDGWGRTRDRHYLFMHSFCWNKSREGRDYWEDIYQTDE